MALRTKLLVLSLCLVHVQTSLFIADAITTQPKPTPIGPIHTLILTRHGDSMWNGKYPGCQETFTGWTDVGLSPIGEQEAIRTGQLLTQYTGGVNIDALFTSTLTRAKMTAHHCWWAYYDRLEEQYRHEKHYQYYNQPGQQQRQPNQQYQAPAQFIIDHRLNERHYGSLQGLVKADCETGLHGHSPEEVYAWRRSWTAIPPPLPDNDPRRIEDLRRFGNICGEENIPRSESLEMCADKRLRPFLDDRLTPMLDEAYGSNLLPSSEDEPNEESAVPEGGTALIVAHANSLCALIGVLCNVEQDDDPSGALRMRKLEAMKIPTANPLVIRYRKTVEEGRYHPIDSALETGVKNELPVYPLSTLPLLRNPPTPEADSCTAAEVEQNDGVASAIFSAQ